MSTKTMACMSCGRTKAYPDGFPDRAFAECWQCAWDAHIRNSHPEVVRRIKRAAKKRARRITERDVIAAMTEAERRQVYPATPDPNDEPGARAEGESL